MPAQPSWERDLPAPDQDFDDYISGSAHTRLSAKSLYRAVLRGELPAIRVGRSVRFRRTDLDAWMESHVDRRDGAR